MRTTEPTHPAATPTPPRRTTRLAVIDAAHCTGCGWCIAACEPRVLSLEVVRWKKISVLHDAPGCTGCSLCFVKCPFNAISMQRPAAETAPGEPHVD